VSDVDVVELDGRFVWPGLWDAHAHMGQWALRRSRVDVSAAGSAVETVALVRAAIGGRAEPGGRARRDPHSVLVGQGFRDALWADAPAAELLDAIDVPVALVSGDVHAVWSNAAALRMLGRPASDWFVREQAAFDLNVQLSSVPEAQLDALVLEAARAAARRGVVGVADFEFDDAQGAWRRRFAAGFGGLRVRAMVYPPHLDSGMPTDEVDGAAGLLTGGELKLFTDGSLNTRTAW